MLPLHQGRVKSHCKCIVYFFLNWSRCGMLPVHGPVSMAAHGPVSMATEALLLQGLTILVEWKLEFAHHFPWALPCPMVPHGCSYIFNGGTTESHPSVGQRVEHSEFYPGVTHMSHMKIMLLTNMIGSIWRILQRISRETSFNLPHSD